MRDRDRGGGVTSQEPIRALALMGFHDALGRHERLRTTADPIAMFVPVTEATYWAATLAESMWSWDGFEDALCRLPGGPVIAGVRYARHVATHRLPLTLRRAEGMTFPMTFPLVFSEVVWLPFAELPPLRDPHGKRPIADRNRQVESYKSYLAGRPTRTTLDEVASFFAALAASSESPLRDVYLQGGGE